MPSALHAMNAKLLRSCIWAWLIGLAGMFLFRTLLDLEPQAMPFQISARLWMVGGLGYAGLGFIQLAAPKSPRRVESSSGDLSALIKKR